ncbi:hypothetical protein AB0D34_31180 [Streptomyces sp. NPDC048420]|uniref:hypothetical protein n=1 Tax=Streptomyces sp. NPDC048420 TaxID=3155755 RepID=UPI00342BB7DD
MATKPTWQAVRSEPPGPHALVTRTPTPADATAEETLTPSLSELLIRSAVGLRDRTAVQALVEEDKLLSRDNVRTALVSKQNGVMTCRWESVAKRTHTLGLDDGEQAFLELVLSIAGIRQSYLTAVALLDERRLKILLQALTRLACNDRIAIGTRV